MAIELRDSFFDEIFRYKERWYNLVHYITFEECKNELPEEIKDRYLIFNDHISYRAILTKPKFKFICTKVNPSDDDYMKDESYCSVWHLGAAFLSCRDSPFFYIDSFKINQHLMEMDKTQLPDNILQLEGYSDELIDLIGKEVQFDYVVRSIVRKASNFFSVKIPVPTKEVRVTFDIRNTSLKRISVLPFFTSKTSVQKRPNNTLNPTNIELYLSDWVFPISGISCILQDKEFDA